MPSLTSSNSLMFFALSLLLNTAACAQTAAPDANALTPEQTETFAIPEGIKNFEQLIAFVEELSGLEPAGESEQEKVAHHRKFARTIVAAAEQIFSGKISDQGAKQSVDLKLQGLRFLQELGEPKASERLAEAIEAAQADKRPLVQAVGEKFMIESGFARWGTWGKEEKTKLIDKIIVVVSSRKPDEIQVDLVMKVVDFLGDRNDEVYARQLLTKLMPHFQTSKNPQMQQMLTSLQGLQRRMNLPGNEIKLTGTMLDGSELDWASYRGKVVLVDFWATWCGPCRTEVPNVLKMYHAYHDKGFEVLGISLDERREQAESYIKQTKIPWPSLFSEKPAERGWKNPMAVRYGITGIPRAILVDREGKVVHMTARGVNLGRELRRLLGEPVARSQRRTDTFVQQASNAP